MMRGRLAPSPTGALHLGNARTFLLAWLSARAQGGSIILRIEDLDGPRVKPGAAAAVIADLRWLGLDWDAGPDIGGLDAPYVQTERLDQYDAAIATLRRRGLVFPCVCTRSDIERAASAPHVGDDGPRYPGTCRSRAAVEGGDRTIGRGRAPAFRFRVADGPVRFHDLAHGAVEIDVARQVGDFVIQKGSGTPAYQLAVVVDDAAMKVTEVVRADDLLSSTPRQLLLYRALGLEAPTFRHVPLVVGPDGLRLAKRHGDTRIATCRDRGVPAERLVGQLAYWSGLVDECVECMPRDLLNDFAWSRVPRTPVICEGDTLLTKLCGKTYFRKE